MVFYKQTEKGFSVFVPSCVAGVFEKKAGGSLVCFETCVYSVVEVWRWCGVVVIRDVCEDEGIQVPDRGEATVRRVKGAVTLSHSWWCGDSGVEMDSIVRSGVATASAARLRRDFVRVRMK